MTRSSSRNCVSIGLSLQGSSALPRRAKTAARLPSISLSSWKKAIKEIDQHLRSLRSDDEQAAVCTKAFESWTAAVKRKKAALDTATAALTHARDDVRAAEAAAAHDCADGVVPPAALTPTVC